VLGLLACLLLVSSTLALCAEINVDLGERLYPRALLTPFTDHVDLTPTDRKTYTKKAKAERVTAFQRVSVRFRDLNRKAGDSPAVRGRPAG